MNKCGRIERCAIRHPMNRSNVKNKKSNIARARVAAESCGLVSRLRPLEVDTYHTAMQDLENSLSDLSILRQAK